MKTYHINGISANRQLEREMLDLGRPEDLERIGVEVGYTVAQQKFGIKDLVISESPRGLELYPRDRTAVLRTKLLDLRKVSPEKRLQVQAEAVNKLAAKVSRELGASASAKVGFVFVSYFNEDKVVKMDVVEIPRSDSP
jgi:hypothetical protein